VKSLQKTFVPLKLVAKLTLGFHHGIFILWVIEAMIWQLQPFYGVVSM